MKRKTPCAGEVCWKESASKRRRRRCLTKRAVSEDVAAGAQLAIFGWVWFSIPGVRLRNLADTKAPVPKCKLDR